MRKMKKMIRKLFDSLVHSNETRVTSCSVDLSRCGKYVIKIELVTNYKKAQEFLVKYFCNSKERNES